MAGIGVQSGCGKNKQKKPSQEGLGEWGGGGAGSGVGVGKIRGLPEKVWWRPVLLIFLSKLLLVEVDCQFIDQLLLLFS